MAAWGLLRLSSPQLPIGGYSYSQALELAIEQGLVHDSDSAATWLGDQLLLNLARFEVPLLKALCDAVQAEDWPLVAELDARQRSSRETRELAQENRQMGYSLRQLLSHLPELSPAAQRYLADQPDCGLAAAWALAAQCWQVDSASAVQAWLWAWLENQLAVLMKALPLGQQAAQGLLSALQPTLHDAYQHACAQPLAHCGSAPFGLALASMAHEQQYSRLFRS